MNQGVPRWMYLVFVGVGLTIVLGLGMTLAFPEVTPTQTHAGCWINHAAGVRRQKGGDFVEILAKKESFL